MEKSVAMEEQQTEQAVSRIISYPVVSDSITKMTNFYESTKQKNNLVRYALEKAEVIAGTVATSTKDQVFGRFRYEKQIASINSIALSQLDKLEEKYPVITKPTSEAYEEGVQKYDSTLKPTVDRVVNKVYAAKDYGIETVESVKKYSTEKATEIKDYGMGKVSDAMKTPYGVAVTEKVDELLDVADNYVDYYLPKKDENEEESNEASDTVSKASKVSNKLKNRMFAKSLENISSAKQRSQEALEKLHFTVDLMQYTQKGLTATQQKLWDTWEEINKPVDEEDANDAENKSMERRAILVARRLTAQVKSGIESVTQKAVEAPAYVQDALDKSSTYSTEMYNYFKKVTNYDELSEQVLDQHRDKIVYIQNTLNYLSDFVNWPLKSGEKQLEQEDTVAEKEESMDIDEKSAPEDMSQK